MIPHPLEHYVVSIVFEAKDGEGDNDYIILANIPNCISFKEYNHKEELATEFTIYLTKNDFKEMFSDTVTPNEMKKLNTPLFIVQYDGPDFEDWLIDQELIKQIT
jgi:hypothetical protein